MPERQSHETQQTSPTTPAMQPAALQKDRSLSAYGPARSTVQGTPLSPDELRKIDAYWRACNYLCLGMIYLRDNPLLREPLKLEHLKKRLLGHWGSSPGLSFAYIHLNRLINKYDLNAIFLAGPGHGAPAVLAPVYLEGTYCEIYPEQERGRGGHARVLQGVLLPRRHRQPLHAGDAGLHPRGRRARLQRLARLRCRLRQPRPDRRRSMVGDGESETGPLATSWHSNKFLNPIRDGAVLPILHLNGYKINNPTILSRISPRGAGSLFGATAGRLLRRGQRSGSHAPGDGRDDGALRAGNPPHPGGGAASGKPVRPRWPMIVLRTPKGWTGPEEVDGHKVEGFWRAHQVPLSATCRQPGASEAAGRLAAQLQAEELFDEQGRLVPELKALAPKGTAA